MKNFVVSARKYRPAVFAHVLGQPHITTTLRNALREQHLAQAFLFCGPRGVGKTTCARILAKAINCEQVTEAAEPCNACASCTSFNSGSSLNVYELDAASNNSVEDIRALVEQVRYPPQAGRYKTYIIDEVHMLSNAAFNAFLKTLEEPPSYAIFILATTEKHKIIPTILSRCQIFDFHRIQPQDVVKQLQHIAALEGIVCEEEALHLIGQKADGALRDALSMFDLLVTFAAGQGLTYQAVLEHLHILDYAYYFRLMEACLHGQAAEALLCYDEILRKGFDGQHFVVGLAEHLRNLLVCQDQATLALLEVTDGVRAQYQVQAMAVGTPFLLQALQIVSQCDLHYKGSNNKRLHVELALMDLAQIRGEVTLTPPPDVPSRQTIKTPETATKPPKTLEAAPETVKTPNTPETATKTPKTLEAAPQPPKSPKKAYSTEAAATPAVKERTLPSTLRLPQLDQLKESFEAPTAQPTVAAAATTTPQPTAPATQPLTEADVHRHWQAYAQRLKEADNMTAYSVLSQGVTLEGSSTLVVKLVSSVQQDVLHGLKEDLMATLRQQLQHPALELRATVTAQTKTTKPYTAQEKFKYLAEKYPSLRTLQEALALEVQD